MVTVMSRPGCHLCEVAEADVARICGELGVEWAVTDVDADPQLRAEYGDRVPVILIDGANTGTGASRRTASGPHWPRGNHRR